jgi:hypothetical protein
VAACDRNPGIARPGQYQHADVATGRGLGEIEGEDADGFCIGQLAGMPRFIWEKQGNLTLLTMKLQWILSNAVRELRNGLMDGIG